MRKNGLSASIFTLPNKDAFEILILNLILLKGFYFAALFYAKRYEEKRLLGCQKTVFVNFFVWIFKYISPKTYPNLKI